MLDTTAEQAPARAAGVPDTPEARKARGAFFTPPAISGFIARWAVRMAGDRVFEPAAGDASFLVPAVERLAELAPGERPAVDGVEIHPASAALARSRVSAAGGVARLEEADFFSVRPRPDYSAVIGNPPFIRYQDFSGEARSRSLQAALAQGVALSKLSSSWAAFTVHATGFLAPGGRLGLVLPAELLSVNYAGAVRKFLFERFASVELVMFAEQVFPGAEADVVLLLADGWGQGPAGQATVRHVRNAEDLDSPGDTRAWAADPADPTGKWTTTLVDARLLARMAELEAGGMLASLETWGDTTLGMVTGNNKYFALSPQRAASLVLPARDLLRLSPPGSAHLRGLTLSAQRLSQLGEEGRATLLFRPAQRKPLDPATEAYIAAGEHAGVNQAYKCRIRTPWYRVPLLEPADLLLTCMNADAPRIVANPARARHLNSVHGVYLHGGNAAQQALAVELLPLAALNSASLLSAELVGRSYGGGILKLEPREADRWAMPAPALLAEQAEALRGIKPAVARLLERGRLLDAAARVDDILLRRSGVLGEKELAAVREAHGMLMRRRRIRGGSGR